MPYRIFLRLPGCHELLHTPDAWEAPKPPGIFFCSLAGFEEAAELLFSRDCFCLPAKGFIQKAQIRVKKVGLTHRSAGGYKS